MESNIDTAHLQSSNPREQQKKHGYLSLYTTSNTISPTTSFLNRPISSGVTLYRDRVEQDIREDNHGATLLPLLHYFFSSLKIKKVQYRMKRSGRSYRSLTSDERARATNTKSAGK